MVDFLSADVVTEEVQGKNGQIPTASTSALAICGYSPRGPEGKAFIHSSFSEFAARFGSFSKKSLNAYAAFAYFANGGNRLMFVREMHADAVAAQGSLGVSGNYLVKASGRGVWAIGAKLVISGSKNFYNISTAQYSAFDVDVFVIDPNSGLLVLSESYEGLNLSDPTDPDYMTAVLNDASEDVIITDQLGGVPSELMPTAFSGSVLGTGDGATTSFTATIASQNLPLAAGACKILVGATVVATDDGLGNIIGVSGGPAVTGTINYTTGVVAVSITPAPAASASITMSGFKAPAASVSVTLAGGSDGSAVIASDVVAATLEPLQEGIYALDLIDEEMSICLPDYAGDPTTDLALLTYCEGRGDMVAILQPPKGSSPQSAVNYRRAQLASVSSYGAIYYPWLKMADPLNNNRPITVPPCAHVAGRYAYTDLKANVGKAPAGTDRGALQAIIGVERVLSKGDRDTVYQAQINPIRSDANVGVAIWGNKTLQIVGDFTDVNIRRLFIFLEKVQYVGLLDQVFEDVGPAEWGIIKTRLNSFLEQLFLGGVIGSGVSDKSQAFKVVVDASNNPPSVQQQKQIVIDEFIKPDLASEVIHLRLQRVFDASQV